MMGKVIAKMISYLLDIKNNGKIGPNIEVVNQTLKSELDIDIELLLEQSTNNFIENLIDNSKLNNSHIEQLSELFYLLATDATTNENIKLKLMERTILMYNYLEQHQSCYSFERMIRLEEMQAWIENQK